MANCDPRTGEETLRLLGMEHPPALWLKHWDEAEQEFARGFQELPTEADIRGANTMLKLPADAVEAICKAAERIGGNRDLQRLLSQWHFHFCHIPVHSLKDLYGWPLPNAVMGAEAALFPAIAIYSGLDHMREIHKARNIPSEVMEDTLADMRIWLEDYHTRHGVWGLKEYGWLAWHISGHTFQLGRLQFAPATYGWKFRAYRNTQTGLVLAVAEDGATFRGDGQFDGTNGIFDEDGRWVSEFVETEHSISANPIAPCGVALHETVALSKDVWKLVLKHGDPILEVHIPAGSKISRQACGESFAQARRFFSKHFPETTFNAFTCDSWLLDPQFQEILAVESNIVLFEREFYILPNLSSDGQTFERVFGGKPNDLATARRDTSLRRAILDYVLAGHQMHRGAGFIMMEDLDWGSQSYQTSD